MGSWGKRVRPQQVTGAGSPGQMCGLHGDRVGSWGQERGDLGLFQAVTLMLKAWKGCAEVVPRLCRAVCRMLIFLLAGWVGKVRMGCGGVRFPVG